MGHDNNTDYAQLFDFSNKRVLITGSTRGIGKEIARGFSKTGAEVILHGRNKQLLDALSQEINAEYVMAELSSSEQVENMVSQLINKYDTLDVLINNAGFEIRKPYEEFSMEEFDNIFAVNIRSVFQLTKGLFPLLKNAGGASVINMSSVHETLAYPTNLVYSMTKAAMGMFSHIVGIEWAPYNIRVNSLAPGAIYTEMNGDVIEEIGKGKFSTWIGSGSIGRTHDVLNACLYLACDMSSYMTSETLFLDGALSKGLLPYGVTAAMEDMRARLIESDKK